MLADGCVRIRVKREMSLKERNKNLTVKLKFLIHLYDSGVCLCLCLFIGFPVLRGRLRKNDITYILSVPIGSEIGVYGMDHERKITDHRSENFVSLNRGNKTFSFKYYLL